MSASSSCPCIQYMFPCFGSRNNIFFRLTIFSQHGHTCPDQMPKLLTKGQEFNNCSELLYYHRYCAFSLSRTTVEKKKY